MELQEAINHALEVSEKEEECDICKSEHKQLADWRDAKDESLEADHG